jgi:hypothetical protein
MSKKQLLLTDLASLLNASANALHCRASRDPSFLPPSYKVPGDRRRWFDPDIVEQWLRDRQLVARKSGRVSNCRGRASC